MQILKEVIEKIKQHNNSKTIRIISHNDTDGITSAVIFSRTLQRFNKKFDLKIVKNLENDFIENLPENELIVFLDLGSGSLENLSKKNSEIIIIDHHLISSDKIPKNITMVNPNLQDLEPVASSALCYLISKDISTQNKDLASLAVIGMIGDMLEKNIGKIYKSIIDDAEIVIKKGPLLYPATRPIDKVLENSSHPYIPNVSGSYKGTIQLLKEAGIEKQNNRFKSISEMNKQEISNLGTAIMLKKITGSSTEDFLGNIFLINLFNTQHDAREVSAMLNACSRLGNPDIALGYCLGNKAHKTQADKLYTKYKKTISSALGQVQTLNQISGKNYTIINAQDKIQDTIIGTIASIVSFSPLYPEGTVIIAMAYDQQKIKVSARVAGRKGRNVREILHKATIPISTEIGGHPLAAGCLIPKDKEHEFINNLKQTLDIELVKV